MDGSGSRINSANSIRVDCFIFPFHTLCLPSKVAFFHRLTSVIAWNKSIHPLLIFIRCQKQYTPESNWQALQQTWLFSASCWPHLSCFYFFPQTSISSSSGCPLSQHDCLHPLSLFSSHPLPYYCFCHYLSSSSCFYSWLISWWWFWPTPFSSHHSYCNPSSETCISDMCSAVDLVTAHKKPCKINHPSTCVARSWLEMSPAAMVERLLCFYWPNN